MKVNPAVFKSYDIRGTYPDELNERAAREIGRAFVCRAAAKRVAVGRDMRLSSPALFKAITEGIMEQGADVFDMGQVPTECLYFAVGGRDFDAGVMITASHNPKEYNGFKMVKKEGSGFSMIRGTEMAAAVEKEKPESPKKGVLTEKDLLAEYAERLFSLVKVEGIKPFRVVIDAGNGMAGKVIPLIKERLPINIVPLNFELDGSFPAHPSNILEKGAAEQVGEKVRREKADFGFAFDGDADRIYLIDELGNLVSADITLLFLARHLLEENPGGVISYNLICSKSLPEFIEKWGGKPVRTRVGFVNVRDALIENRGIMGGELSGHYCFRDNFYGDSAFLALLILLKAISNSDKSVSAAVSQFQRYYRAPEINFKIENKQEILQKIKDRYSDGKQDYLDGVTVEYENWWFNVRPSQTEPLLRLTIEADTKKVFEEKKKELTGFIQER